MAEEYIATDINCDYVGCGCELMEKIIRCKNCVYYKKYSFLDETHEICIRFNGPYSNLKVPVKANDFCSWAERKESE